MRIQVITLFPEEFTPLVDIGVTGRGIRDGKVELELLNPRDFAADRHRSVDDRPYGGGPGMVMAIEPLRSAIRMARARAEDRRERAEGKARVGLLSPQGRRLDHEAVAELAQRQELILVCGRYEGIDERLIELEVDEEWSIGDYVLSGGELAAAVIIDAITRLLPGVLGDEQSAHQDSFTDGLLDFQHYTRPENVEGLQVPPVLLSGDHQGHCTMEKKAIAGPHLAEKAGVAAADGSGYRIRNLAGRVHQGKFGIDPNGTCPRLVWCK